MSANFRGGNYGGLFRSERDPVQSDDSLIASRVLEQLSNVRSAEQSTRQKATEDIAKRPPMTRVVTENADGTVNIGVKNAPTKDPTTAISEAAATPHVKWLETIVGSLDKGAETFQPDYSAIDQGLQTPEGRRKLLSEIGVDKPDFGVGGLLGWARKADAYDRLVADPEKVKRAVIASKMRDFSGSASMSRPFAQDVNAEENQQRILDSQKRAEDRQAMSDRERAIDNVRQFDFSHMASPDEAVKQWENIYGESWKEMGPTLEPLIRSEYFERGLIKQKAALEEARKKETDERSQKRLELQIRSVESLIKDREQRDKPKARKTTRTDAKALDVSDLEARAGDEEYDQTSLREAWGVRETDLKDEQGKLTSRRNIKRARETALKSKPFKETGDVEELATISAEVADANSRLAAIARDLETVRAHREGTAKKPAAAGEKDPAGIR